MCLLAVLSSVPCCGYVLSINLYMFSEGPFSGVLGLWPSIPSHIAHWDHRRVDHGIQLLPRACESTHSEKVGLFHRSVCGCSGLIICFGGAFGDLIDLSFARIVAWLLPQTDIIYIGSCGCCLDSSRVV